MAILVSAGFCVWGQQAASADSATDKLKAAASLFGPVQSDTPVVCTDSKACSASNRVLSVNEMIDGAFAESAAARTDERDLKEAMEFMRQAKSQQQMPEPETLRPAPQDLPLPVNGAQAAVSAPARESAAAPQNAPDTAVSQPVAVPQKAKPAPFDPNEFRPNVKWSYSKSTHFDIYTQKTAGNIGSANLAMTFESSYQTLRRFIPWMMSDRVRVFVYENVEEFLENEKEAKSWTRALAYPLRGEIVVYDVPGRTQELKEVFSHELTHIFTQKFFDGSEMPTVQPPLWLDEGLAVLVEDQAYTGSNGGPWNNDYLTRVFVRSREKQNNSFASGSVFRPVGRRPPSYGNIAANPPSFGVRRRRGKPIRLMPFSDFVQENSLDSAEAAKNTQNWYLQAYLMVRFLLNPSGGSSPSNRMQFERFTRLLAEGEALRSPETGYLVKDKNGKQVYKKYTLEEALGRTYWYNSLDAFEDAFWKWLNK